MKDKIEELTVKSVFDRKDDNYQIPIYQRNYAWGEKQITALIQDIFDSMKNNIDRNYFIGTLVVAESVYNGSTFFEVIDGQQRLTTLSILLSAIKADSSNRELEWYKRNNLTFQSRTKSRNSIELIFNNKKAKKPEEVESNMIGAYDICKKILRIKSEEYAIIIAKFTKFLLEKVIIVRVPLSEGTDLNHYFEIMNSRGEQLEKHEIVKAKLLKTFNGLDESIRKKYQYCFHLIWEACSDMEKYIQYGFSTEQRHLIFGQNQWSILSVDTFDEVVDNIGLSITEELKEEALTLTEILKKKEVSNDLKKKDPNSPDRFNSVINFQNFLLHVLRITKPNLGVTLDDKQLIVFFEKAMEEGNEMEFVKRFIFNLLKCKFLFDQFIIKREFTGSGDDWSLKKLKWYSSGKEKNTANYSNTFNDSNPEGGPESNRRIVMLLSMFHVSNPSMSYKYWLNATLSYLYFQFEVSSSNYILYLEHLAKLFVYDRFLDNEERDYNEIVNNYGLPSIKSDKENLNKDLLTYKKIRNNLVFNFVDYLLWMQYYKKDERIRNFKYTFRSSVEHHYPQNPIEEEIQRIDDTFILHSFGNLCLISHEKNSRYGNYPPLTKKSQYGPKANIDSIKQYLMMQQPKWDSEDIKAHEYEMIKLLKDNVSSTYEPNDGSDLASRLFKQYQKKKPITLIRTMLCFGDCLRQIRWDKYNFKDLDYMKNHEAFDRFKEYIEKHPTTENLEEVINQKLQDEDFPRGLRYLLAKYPETVAFSKLGNIILGDFGQMQLLAAHKNTLYKSRNIYCLILQKELNKKLGCDLYCDKYGLYIPIIFQTERYEIVKWNEDISFEIRIFYSKNYIHCNLIKAINGNSKEIKLIKQNGWNNDGSGIFLFKGKSKFVKLGDDFEDNVQKINRKILKLLKEQFEIK